MGSMPAAYKSRHYEAERNKLIPVAIAHANRMAGLRPRKKMHKGQNDDPELTAWVANWNYAYHQKMNDLAKAIKL